MPSPFTPQSPNHIASVIRVNDGGETVVAANDERQERRTEEREQITARIAQFKATQERFAREREEYATTTWKKASRGEHR